jgi:hypothetical protein
MMGGKDKGDSAFGVKKYFQGDKGKSILAVKAAKAKTMLKSKKEGMEEFVK